VLFATDTALLYINPTSAVGTYFLNTKIYQTPNYQTQHIHALLCCINPQIVLLTNLIEHGDVVTRTPGLYSPDPAANSPHQTRPVLTAIICGRQLYTFPGIESENRANHIFLQAFHLTLLRIIGYCPILLTLCPYVNKETAKRQW